MKYLITILMLSLFSLSTQGSEEKRITVATLEFSPYVSAKLPNNGWAWEIVEEAFSRQGYQAKLRIMPWARAVEMTKDGQVDALYLANKNPERETWAVFSEPVGEELSVAFKHVEKDIRIHSLSDLTFYSVIGLRGSHVVDKIRKAGVEISGVANIQQGIQMLFYQRADLFVADHYVTNYMLDHEFPQSYKSTIEFLDTPLDVNQLHLAISRKIPNHLNLVKLFNAGLEEITADGTYQRILEKHGFE
ncbi:substrate-binding periplasmic protein [Litoribrevibacter albus]|uniref:ABC transporter substrate-binding protein n=1 Tax=Litoribrevibacter albus TaxID=1473156 RepID=A0AA37S6I5_9GAMM|nr:transporter substrate-binding domain-containing protein [Litoribrevibacter albus]GLQ29600.1 ABC transporter substrate-binding protein [Litoribrevibacter albus]